MMAKLPVGVTQDLFAARSIDQLRLSLIRHAAHIGFCCVGGWTDRGLVKNFDDTDLGRFSWDNFTHVFGESQARDYRAARSSSINFKNPSEAVERIKWRVSQLRPFAMYEESPLRFKSHVMRYLAFSKDFGVQAVEVQIVPDPADKSGLSRLFATTDVRPSTGDTAAVNLLLTSYYYMREVLLSMDGSGGPLALPDRGTDRPVDLSPRQLEILAWAAAGKTLQDIADITGLRQRTVRYHIECARDRYGFTTSQQTIVRAALDYDFDPLGPA